MQALKNININKLAILIGSAVAMLIVAYVPSLQSAEAEIISAVTLITLGLIAGDSLDNIARAWLAKPGNVDRATQGAQQGIDLLERTFRIDIPDELEAAAVKALYDRLQREVAATVK